MEVPKFPDDDPPSLTERLARIVDLRPPVTNAQVTSYPSWTIELDPLPGGGDRIQVLAVGHGPPLVVSFDDAMLEQLLEWLAAPAAAWLDDLSRAMDTRGNLINPDALPDEQALLDTLPVLLLATGDLGLLHPTPTQTGIIPAVDALYLSLLLASLRSCLLLALALQRLDTPAGFWSKLIKEMETLEPGLTLALTTSLAAGDTPERALARLWFISRINELELARVTRLPASGARATIQPGPRTPLQVAWFTIALSAGAIEPPYPLPGVFRCAYHRCQRVFVSRRMGVGGKLRFCSVQHGKSYHAAKRMKQKSKKNRAKPGPEV